MKIKIRKRIKSKIKRKSKTSPLEVVRQFVVRPSRLHAVGGTPAPQSTQTDALPRWNGRTLDLSLPLPRAKSAED